MEDNWKVEGHLDKHIGCPFIQGKDMWGGHKIHMHLKVTCYSN